MNFLPFYIISRGKWFTNHWLVTGEIGSDPSCVISTAMTHGHASQFYVISHFRSRFSNSQSSLQWWYRATVTRLVHVHTLPRVNLVIKATLSKFEYRLHMSNWFAMADRDGFKWDVLHCVLASSLSNKRWSESCTTALYVLAVLKPPYCY